MIAAIACKKKRVLQNSTGQRLRQGKVMQNCLVKVSYCSVKTAQQVAMYLTYRREISK
jgi:hypothetical protein